MSSGGNQFAINANSGYPVDYKLEPLENGYGSAFVFNLENGVVCSVGEDIMTGIFERLEDDKFICVPL